MSSAHHRFGMQRFVWAVGPCLSGMLFLFTLAFGFRLSIDHSLLSHLSFHGFSSPLPSLYLNALHCPFCRIAFRAGLTFHSFSPPPLRPLHVCPVSTRSPPSRVPTSSRLTVPSLLSHPSRFVSPSCLSCPVQCPSHLSLPSSLSHLVSPVPSLPSRLVSSFLSRPSPSFSLSCLVSPSRLFRPVHPVHHSRPFSPIPSFRPITQSLSSHTPECFPTLPAPTGFVRPLLICSIAKGRIISTLMHAGSPLHDPLTFL